MNNEISFWLGGQYQLLRLRVLCLMATTTWRKWVRLTTAAYNRSATKPINAQKLHENQGKLLAEWAQL